MFCLVSCLPGYKKGYTLVNRGKNRVKIAYGYKQNSSIQRHVILEMQKALKYNKKNKALQRDIMNEGGYNGLLRFNQK